MRYCARCQCAYGSAPGGDLFRVSRGQVTGCNAVWIAGDHTREIPPRFLLPCVTGAEEIFNAWASGGRLNDISHLRRVVDLPKDLEGLDPSERDPVLRFLEWAREKKAGLCMSANTPLPSVPPPLAGRG
jgi:adenine-specific DNA-methyltransferase